MTQDQREILEMMDRAQWEAMIALMESLVVRQKERVLKCSVTDGARAILLAKANLDGAIDLITGVARARAQITKEK
jgi:hypothetical protein